MGSADIDKKKALGRGLASLIPDAEGPMPGTKKKDYFLCDIEKVVPNTYQPRKIFKKEALEDLVDSIRNHGILQPLVVRVREGRYELIAGERRWRAAQKAGLKQVPVVVKKFEGDAPSLEMALIENVQREDLNCIEEAIAYQQLMDEFQLSHEDIASRIGKSRTTIVNTIRLLKLPTAIREDVTNGKLSMGHARAILSLESTEDQMLVRDLILSKKLSVRETEKKVNELLSTQDRPDSTQAEAPQKNVHIEALQDKLRRHFGAKVRILGNEKKGLIQIAYTDMQELNRLSELIFSE